MKWKETAEGLVVEGVAIEEGTYQGIDGHKVFYPADVLIKAAKSLVNKRVKLRHQDTDDAVIGYVSAVRPDAGKILVQAKIFDKNVVELIKNGKFKAFSVETRVLGELAGDVYIANNLEFESIAIVENPACPTARIKNIRETKLEEKKMVSVEDCIKELKEKGDFNKISEECKKKLKEAGYPYPYPETKAKNEEYESKLNALKAKLKEKDAKIKELEEKVKGLEAELEKRDTETLNALMEEISGKSKFIDVKMILEPIKTLQEKIEVLRRIKKSLVEKKETKLEAPEKKELSEDEVNSLIDKAIKEIWRVE